jgi:hypothetical protein
LISLVSLLRLNSGASTVSTKLIKEEIDRFPGPQPPLSPVSMSSPPAQPIEGHLRSIICKPARFPRSVASTRTRHAETTSKNLPSYLRGLRPPTSPLNISSHIS